MRRYYNVAPAFFIAAAMLQTTSCTTLPSITSEEILSVDDIINQIQCETQSAFSNVREFNVGAAASISGTNTNRRTVNITFGFVLGQIDEIKCRGRTRDNLPLTSNLGIPEWILRSLEPFSDKRNIAQPTLIGSTLDFIIDTSGRITPGIALITAPNSSTAYGGIFSGGRKDTHTLEISIKPVT